ncbi:MAG: hypothetical protein HYR60_12530 [Acidobacteria bacterium]|nr:hypothetical protein [Acidobacteriota bacterium]
MNRRTFLAATVACTAATPRRTTVSIRGDQFLLNGRPTYPGRSYQGMKIEGLLLNARLVQGIFDDRNPETVSRWKYPDSGVWDAERNTREFIAAMPEWRRHGLLSFTLNLQGGSPEGYSKGQPWHNSAFEADGSLRPDYLARLRLILDRADELGMAPIVGYFYFGQDERLAGDEAVRRGVEEASRWLLDNGYRNVMVEIANECDNRGYQQPLLQAPRIHELIRRVQSFQKDGRRLLVGASFNGGRIPTPNVVAASDFLLLHGNGVKDPERIAAMVAESRAVPGYRPMPILFNEDDHFDFDRPVNNMMKAIAAYASWGYFDPEGYQCPPVNWGLGTERKRAFFAAVRRVSQQP